MFIVYRGQGLNKEDFKHLNSVRGGFLSVNDLLSTSVHSQIESLFDTIRQ